MVFAPGKVGSLSGYLNYFFLRFPGTLGPEETWDLEGLDTYDRRWTRQGQIWVRRGESVWLVEPPSMFAFQNNAATAFGLQKPLVLGKVSVKIRSLEFFSADTRPLEGQLVRFRGHSYLVLRGKTAPQWEALVDALVADGLIPTAGVPLVPDRGPRFEGPDAWTVPRRSDPAAAFLLGRLRDGLRVARQYEKGIRDDVDTECLHQYRVHLRRVRSLASLGRMWELIPEWNRLKVVLRALQQQTNELRDLDVLLLDFPELQARLPWDEGPRLAGWETSLRQRRQKEFRRVKAWLESEEHRFASDEVDRLFDDLTTLGEPWSVGEWTASAFTKSSGALRRSLRGWEEDPPDSALHEVRIQTKRLRYVLDGLGDLGPAPVVRTLTTILKETQEGLGVFQDRSILLDRLKAERQSFRSGKSPVDPLTFGMLVGALAAEQTYRKAEALRESRKLQSKPFLKALARLIEADAEAHDEP